MDVIIETDLGGDPDDFFTLCYLSAIGAKIRMLLVTPGSLDQIAIAKFFRSETNQDFPIFSHKEINKLTSGGVHHAMLKKHNHPLEAKSPIFRHEDLEGILNIYPDANVLVIGPPKCVGNYLTENANVPIKSLTMQGGFLSYHLHDSPLNAKRNLSGILLFQPSI